MDVFLIPVGRDRHELYCEVPDEDPSGAAPDHDRGFFRGLLHRFQQTLAAVERERRHPAADAPRRGLVGRLKERFLRTIAESIAEQRLLWHIRRLSAATAVYPSDLGEADATAIIRTGLRRDLEKHRRWLIIDALLLIVSGLLAVIPGPNLLAYYFAFRVVGHYLSMRGAGQGLDRIAWTLRPSADLASLRPLVDEDQARRRPRVDEIAARLQLVRLTHFFDRVACPGA